ncbi:MAG: hypothetical protein KC613_01950 [Myxococcales bacterium]|nr:hypothetical protein [Myxococcales bacterium]MCB9526071.1 hypothetical protein [Myxococcales bacterium]
MRFLLAAVALAATPALADDLPPTTRFDARVATCVPGHKHGKIKAVTRLADGRLIQGTFADGLKVLFTTPDDEGCRTVYPVGEASARVRGKFDAAGNVTKAFTMNQAQCPAEKDGGCEQLLVLKDSAGAYRAGYLAGACLQPELTATPLFSKTHQGVIMSCRSHREERWGHDVALFGYQGDRLIRMLHMDTGYSSSAMGRPEVAKRPDGGARCEVGPPGMLKVVAPGPKPVIVTREADMAADDGSIMHARRTWDGKHFQYDGDPKIMDGEPKVVCHDDVP